jgi:hypothetical protein
MAAYVQDCCSRLTDLYGGDARRIWSPPRSAGDLLDALKGFAGIGSHKARIAVFLLTVQFGVVVLDDGTIVSVAECPGLCEQFFPLDSAILLEARAR